MLGLHNCTNMKNAALLCIYLPQTPSSSDNLLFTVFCDSPFPLQLFTMVSIQKMFFNLGSSRVDYDHVSWDNSTHILNSLFLRSHVQKLRLWITATHRSTVKTMTHSINTIHFQLEMPVEIFQTSSFVISWDKHKQKGKKVNCVWFRQHSKYHLLRN